ncbi:MAG: transglutaminase domain-containing protein [Pirellulaceae bacterium]|nr:transglutaminase domain-containing protein [Pirellulaceae bacterium]
MGLCYFVSALLTVGWRLTDHVGESINPVAFAVDSFAHVCLVFGLILFAFRPRVGHPAMLALGLLVVMLSVAAGGASQTLASQVAVALVACIAFLIASRWILNHSYRQQRIQRVWSRLPMPIHQANSNQAAIDDRKRIGLLFSVVTVSVFVLATSAIAHMADTVLPDVQRILHDQLTSSFDSVSQEVVIGTTQYVRGSQLGTIRRHMMVDPSEVALTAYAQSAPGYLRGTAFDEYSNGHWDEVAETTVNPTSTEDTFHSRTIERVGEGTMPISGRSTRKLSRFSIYPVAGERVATIEIQNDSLKGHVFFAPMGTRWIEASARSIRLSSHDVIEHGINRRFPYIAGVSAQPAKVSLGQRRREVLVQVAPEIAAAVSSVSNSICRDQLTSRSKAAAIESYFQREYTYSLQGTPVPGRTDPLVHFLETKHPANCEYFASATVLLLRSAGVPARYVTGYVSSEISSEVDGQWIARNRDAHAWVEAYDEVSQSWFPVESTPGRSYQTLTQSGAQVSSLADSLADMQGVTNENQSIIGWLWDSLISFRATNPLTLLIRFGQVPLFLLAAYLLWRRFRSGYGDDASSDDVKSRSMLAKVDRKVKRHSLERAPSETLHQFAVRIESIGSPRSQTGSVAAPVEPSDAGKESIRHELTRYADWYRQFAEARYRGKLPTPMNF